ncbi:hypothetical protein Prum_032090 [Phytohabitans rumicis]|uniref:Histidine kinase/HSP90-like ATPase domain-containing protein n=1 Tax=Phytohabitans rumicis TaxID=1076125 RepID=A0A6V8L6B4_9ACTN|nr:hypothetical protein Prum_032090 [Phytohabitans rumicis]
MTQLRHAVASCVAAAGLVGQRLDDFVLAVNELITNAVRHGGGTGQIRLWRADGTLECEVSDAGNGFDGGAPTDSRPAPDSPSGWGLWLARRLSDHMDVRTGPDGTTVRISTTLAEERAH